MIGVPAGRQKAAEKVNEKRTSSRTTVNVLVVITSITGIVRSVAGLHRYDRRKTCRKTSEALLAKAPGRLS